MTLLPRYPVPPVPTSCVQDMYYTEVLVPQLAPVIVPAKAAWYLIPHHATCVCHACAFGHFSDTDLCKQKAAQHLTDILDSVIAKYPHWNETDGRNHVLVYSWDQASEVLRYNSPIRDRISSCAHVTTLGSTDAKVAKNHNPVKDIVIPPYANYTAPLSIFKRPDWLDIQHLFNSFGFLNDGWMFRKRPILAYSHGVRQYIRELGAVWPERYFVKEGHMDLMTYWQELGNSTFSLCPSGWSPWSPRLFGSIISIPIIFADDSILPFESQIPYHTFTLRIRNADAGTLDTMIRAVSAADVTSKKQRMIRYQDKLVWNLPARPGDAFNTLLE
ncbi:exostosin family-domain-containing protein [Chytriomyces cf. hyalinus JEL632]|nr:exostosin family-domain-containing protein [Chytriomyces cf. hyalinus JEL632]